MFDNFVGDWRANKKNVKGRIILMAFRIANFANAMPKPARYFFYPYLVLYRIIVEWFLCVEIPWKTSIGPGLKLHHGQALVINDRVVIGKGCLLRHSTTIGVSATRADFGGEAPVIGDNVDIGSNVVIIGGIKIGSGSIIAAGSVVIRDVAENTLVAGNPARLIRTLV